MACFVDREEEVTPRSETYSGNVLAMCEWKGVRFVTELQLVIAQGDITDICALYKVKDCYSIPNGGEEVRTIRTE